MFPMLLRTVKVLIIVIVIVMVGVIVDVIDMKVLTLLIIRLIFRCSRCCQASYCGASCQKSHWKTHKKQVALQNYLFYSRTRNITQTNEHLGPRNSLSLFQCQCFTVQSIEGKGKGMVASRIINMVIFSSVYTLKAIGRVLILLPGRACSRGEGNVGCVAGRRSTTGGK